MTDSQAQWMEAYAMTERTRTTIWLAALLGALGLLWFGPLGAMSGAALGVLVMEIASK